MTEKLAVGYTRLSQNSDTSIERQKKHIRDYADEKGFHLGRIYDDGENSSGFTDERPEYQNLLELVDIGAIDAIIVNDKRRLIRDFDGTMSLILDLRSKKIEVHTYQEGRLDLSNPMGVAIEILQAAAEYDAKIKEIERARKAVKERIDEGKYQGRPPKGFKVEEGNLVPADDFETMEKALRLRLVGGETLQNVENETKIDKSTISRTERNRAELVAQYTDDEELVEAIES